MLKIMIIDEKENADIAAAILKGRYEIVTVFDDKGLKERMLAEKPDMLMITGDSDKINFKKVLSDVVRRTPELSGMPAAVLTSTPTHSLTSAAGIMDAEVIVKPYDFFEFRNKADRLGEKLKPLKDRLDETTKLHKREFIEERIQEIFDQKSGTLFIVDVSKYRFASQPVNEEISIKAAEILAEEAGMFNAILGIQKDRKLIGYLPGITARPICQSWGKQVINKILENFTDQKVYVCIGYACNDEKSPTYEDLYQLCDRALNLSRERGSNMASYY